MTKKDSQLLIQVFLLAKMLDKDNQILVNEIRDCRNEVRQVEHKLNTLEVAIWANIFFSFMILLAIAILIINGSNNG